MSGTNIYCDACGYPNRPQASFCFECGQRLPVPGAAPSAVAPTGSMTPRNLLSGHYHITSLAGQGGMGAVYKATDSRLGGRTVAVKEMSQSGLSPQEIAEAEDAFRCEMLT
ncbi:MAG TPA: inactive serine/threonine-protein kinase VRK3, partial [Ktedonobacterales bacterium]